MAMRIAACTEETLIGLCACAMALRSERQRSFQPRPIAEAAEGNREAGGRASRKEPAAIAVGTPVSAQALEHLRSHRHFPVFAAFGVEDANNPARRVDVLRPNRGRFTHAQAAEVAEGNSGCRGMGEPMIDQAKDRLEAIAANRAQEPARLVPGEDQRQRLIAPNLELPPQLPVALQKVAIEHAQRDHRLIECGGPQLLFIAPKDQVIEDLPFGELLE